MASFVLSPHYKILWNVTSLSEARRQIKLVTTNLQPNIEHKMTCWHTKGNDKRKNLKVPYDDEKKKVVTYNALDNFYYNIISDRSPSTDQLANLQFFRLNIV